ncbi:hypothetical protein PVAP13_6NG223600 [Panicum virgatum]|uniref:Myb-like domain-containing protein n=1 Tax=Panicum virgatum TaxID=38727 RepID=A0A8T0QZQ5_PANVG|nr:hypothetical protein PVAP13_6NG223600 [Panicum virgatum]
MGMVPVEGWLAAPPMGMPSIEGSPAMPPMGAAPLLGPRAPWVVASPTAATSLMPSRPNAPRQPKKPTTGLAKAARKKPGPKKKMPSSTLVDSASTPTTNSSASASIAAPNCGTEEDTHAASAHSFSNMMDESVEVENISLFQPLPSADEEHDEDDNLISPTRKKGHRSANYSSDEDVALIRAWEFVSLDAIAGVDQSSSTFWSRISEHFHCNANTTMTRTIGSLQHRWSTIQECCNKWKSCLAQVTRQHPSGVPFQEQERYKAMDQ